LKEGGEDGDEESADEEVNGIIGSNRRRGWWCCVFWFRNPTQTPFSTQLYKKSAIRFQKITLRTRPPPR
jgi:hypothetical protein